MKIGRWIDRKFTFNDSVEIFPAVIERLDGTIKRLEHKTAEIEQAMLLSNEGSGWTILQHVGHLSSIEPLWTGRLDQLLAGATKLVAADMKNKKTEDADYNTIAIDQLLEEFHEIRSATIKRLRGLKIDQVGLSAMHPRLGQPMRVLDLFIFAAEHDDFHLAKITEITG